MSPLILVFATNALHAGGGDKEQVPSPAGRSPKASSGPSDRQGRYFCPRASRAAQAVPGPVRNAAGQNSGLLLCWWPIDLLGKRGGMRYWCQDRLCKPGTTGISVSAYSLMLGGKV